MRYINYIITSKAETPLPNTEVGTTTVSPIVDTSLTNTTPDTQNNNRCFDIFKYYTIGSTIAGLGNIGGLVTLGITTFLVSRNLII